MTENKKQERLFRAYFLEKKKKELRSRNKMTYDYKWKGYDDLIESERLRNQMIEMALISQHAYEICKQYCY